MKEFLLPDSKIIELSEKFLEISGGIKNEGNRESIGNLMSVLGDRFFVSPASTKLEYHNCFPGGLLEHSLRVYASLSKMVKGKDISEDSVIICGLFFGIGKVGSVDGDFYIQNKSEWHREKLGVMYECNKDLVHISTANRSLKLLSDFCVSLNDDEYQAILIQDGQYVEANREYQHRESWLALLLHQAITQACKFEYKRWKAIQ